MDGSPEPRRLVLVEGVSDQLAVRALGRRRGRDLDREGVQVVALGGAHALGRFLALIGPDVRLAGLCDAGEEDTFRRALERSGRGGDLEALGFFVCVEDLEDELIRSLGAPAVERVLDRNGDLAAFRTLKKQVEWRDRPVEEQLRRFMGSGGSRKIRYAPLLVDELDLDRVPRPLELLLRRLGRRADA